MAASTPEINVAGFFGGATELARFLVDQGAASENPERQDADPFGNQLPV